MQLAETHEEKIERQRAAVDHALAQYKEAARYAMHTLKSKTQAEKLIEKAEALNILKKKVEADVELTENEMTQCKSLTPEVLLGMSESQRQVQL